MTTVGREWIRTTTDLYRDAVQPLWGTQRTPERPTLGGGVFDVSTRMGKPLRTWQRYVADVAMEVDTETGLLAYKSVVLVAMRQQGKSELMLPVIAHRCIAMPAMSAKYRGSKEIQPIYDGQAVLYTAQTADVARLRWRRNHLTRMLGAPTIRQHMSDPTDRWGGASLSKQAEAMFFRNGSIYAPGATTGKTAGTGDTLDMALIDEAWSHESARAALGMRPAMLTRDLSQIWSLSMVPGPVRLESRPWKYLQDLIDIGIARVGAGVRSGTAFFMYGADAEAPDYDPENPALWRKVMPNLGAGISEAAVREDFGSMDLADFEAEYLSVPYKRRVRRWNLIRKGTWEDLLDETSQIDGRPTLGVEMSEDRKRAWIVAAGRRADGDWHIEVLEPGDRVELDRLDVEWVLRAAVDIAKAMKAYGVVLDPRRPAGSLRVALEREKIKVLTPTINDIAGGCGRFYDATGQEASTEDTGVRVRHIGQEELDNAVSAAVKLDLGGGSFTFVKRGSLFGLGPLYGGILAMHGHDVLGPNGNRKSKVW
jgi:hypothetical protein